MKNSDSKLFQTKKTTKQSQTLIYTTDFTDYGQSSTII